MWAYIFLSPFIVYLVRACDVTHYHERIGPVHLYAKTGDLPEKDEPKPADAKKATRKTKNYVNFVKVRSKVNPLKIESLGPYHIDLDDIEISSNITLGNVTVTGIKGLSLSYVEVRLSPLLINVNASIPALEFEVDYKLDTLVEAVKQIYGHLEVTLKDLAVSSSLSFKNSKSYLLDAVDVRIDIQDVKLVVDINKFAEESRILILNFLKSSEQIHLNNNVLSRIISIINESLKNISSKRIEDFLLGKPDSKPRPKRVKKPTDKPQHRRKHGN